MEKPNSQQTTGLQAFPVYGAGRMPTGLMVLTGRLGDFSAFGCEMTHRAMSLRSASGEVSKSVAGSQQATGRKTILTSGAGRLATGLCIYSDIVEISSPEFILKLLKGLRSMSCPSGMLCKA